MRSWYSVSWPNVSTFVIFVFHELLTRHVRALGSIPDSTCGCWPAEIIQLEHKLRSAAAFLNRYFLCKQRLILHDVTGHWYKEIALRYDLLLGKINKHAHTHPPKNSRHIFTVGLLSFIPACLSVHFTYSQLWSFCDTTQQCAECSG